MSNDLKPFQFWEVGLVEDGQLLACRTLEDSCCNRYIFKDREGEVFEKGEVLPDEFSLISEEYGLGIQWRNSREGNQDVFAEAAYRFEENHVYTLDPIDSLGYKLFVRDRSKIKKFALQLVQYIRGEEVDI